MAVGPAFNRSDLLPASPPALSLLRVPGVVFDGTDERWLNGITFEPEGCNLQLDADTATADFPYWWECPPGGQNAVDANVTGGTKAIGDNPANVSAEPYWAWVGFACSAMDVGLPDRRAEVEARLRRRLEACLPAIVERELWTGQVSGFSGAETPFLADGASVDDLGSYGYVTALAEVEQALAECSCGGRHLIHVQPRVAAAWKSEQLVELAPSRDHLLTAMGTVVVPGTGYPGTNPGDVAASYSHSYIYGTGMVRVFLGTPTVGALDASTVSRDTNDVELRAERPVLAVFDPCCHVGVQVNLCDRLCAGGS